MMSWKRVHPRIPVESLCAEVADSQERFGFVVDLSPDGLRIEQPLTGRREGRIVQLEFELPEVDEIVWAKGEVCFDRYRNAPGGPVRSTGVRLLAAATRHLRMLRDWVAAAAAARHVEGDGGWALAHASHWRG